MELLGNEIYLRYYEDGDAQQRLEFYMRNRQFFDLYSTTRDVNFYTLPFHEEAIRSMRASEEQDEDYVFGIFFKKSHRLIGTISLTDIIRGPIQAAWVGYSIDKAENGRGIATQALQLVTVHAFWDLKLHRLEAGVMPHNAASIRVLEKVGYEREGLMRKNVSINGRWEDHYHYAIINPND